MTRRSSARDDRQLAALRRREPPLGLDEVSHVEVVAAARTPRPAPPRSSMQLNLARPVPQAEEREAARRAQRHDAAGARAGAASPASLLHASSSYLPGASRRRPRTARTCANVDRLGPRLGCTSLANGFSPRARTRAAFSRRASMSACSRRPRARLRLLLRRPASVWPSRGIGGRSSSEHAYSRYGRPPPRRRRPS